VERIAYGTDPSQFGELTRAGDDRNGNGAAGIAVLIHGGFWRDRYDRTLMHRIANDLAAAGWTTWNLEYRRLGSGGGYPATLEDVAAGIDALAGIDGLDLGGRIVAIGHSAGGQLAAWAATREQPRVPLTAVVLQAGVLDLALAHALGLSGGVVAELMDGGPDERPAAYAAASPRARLPLGVPALVVTGGADGVVPPRISREFAGAARAAGDAVVLHEEPAEEHMGHVEPHNPLWLAVRAWL
jgi:acetyl esterase/lipase